MKEFKSSRVQEFKSSKVMKLRSYDLLLSVFCILLILNSLFSILNCSAQSSKYIFLFIGDGFGVGTLTYSEITAKERGDTLCFSQFPVTGLITTHSANKLVTCSSAAATALASGKKTKNGMLNVSPDSKRILTPVSKTLHEKGFAVGIATTVSIDHATPAGFYAHATSRSDYYDIAKQLPDSGFEFFAGAGFLKPTPKDSISVFTLLRENDYAVSTSIQQCYESKTTKNVLIQPQGKDVRQLPYAIRKNDKDFTLPQITKLGIEKLYAQNKPFFFMIESGLIDWANHYNLAKEAYGEVKEFSEAIQVALAFYKQYPTETLIVVTTDHETGGSQILKKGFRFTTKEHTGNIVPVFAIGAGADKFSGFYDNTNITEKIIQSLFSEIY